MPNFTYGNGNVGFQGNNAMGVQYIAPYSDEVKFDDLLPNVGLSYALGDNQQLYLSYAEGLSAPRTDNLYSVRRQADGSVGRPLPESETTQAYDIGWRLNMGNTIASVAAYYINYDNRIVSSFDPDLGFTVDRNVGTVKIQGVDTQIGQRFGEMFELTASAAFNDSELQDDVPLTGEPFRLPACNWSKPRSGPTRRAPTWTSRTTPASACRASTWTSASAPTSTMKPCRPTPWSIST